jgi:hypothetical protein
MDTYNPYNPYANPYILPQASAQPRPHQEQVPMVNGRDAVQMFPMAPNSSKLFLDNSGTILWLATTDSAAYKTIIPYDIFDHKEPSAQPDMLSQIEQRLQKLEAFMNEFYTPTAADAAITSSSSTSE